MTTNRGAHHTGAARVLAAALLVGATSCGGDSTGGRDAALSDAADAAAPGDRVVGDAPMTDATLATWCQSLRDEWAAFVATASTSCTTAADCWVIGGGDCGCSPTLSPSCEGDPIARSAYSDQARTIQATWEASCRSIGSGACDCATAAPDCENGVCVRSPACRCMCPPDASTPPADAPGDTPG